MDLSDSIKLLPVKSLVIIALLQGLSLWGLGQSIELELRLSTQPQWLFALYSVVLVAPVMLLLGLSGRSVQVYKWTAIFSVVVFILAYFTGSQITSQKLNNYEWLLFTLVATLSIATFKSLMYVQHFATGEKLSYSRLFLLSWRNFFTLGLALLFTLSTWGVLMLWAGLFTAIGIDFFFVLFIQPWFYYPVLAVANGFGVIIFRQQAKVIDTITRIQQALMKFLLVGLVFVSMIFLTALPFTGLAPLWESGGSTLILWMQALMLFFTNAVYQDDPNAQPYKPFIHRFIYCGIALLPLYSAISFYGLTLRVEQYGWSISRCWAFLLWSVLTTFSIGYLWGIIRLRDQWLQQLSWVNVRMGLLVLACMLAVNSPLLDFRKISVNSQIHRLETGLVTLDEFDYLYFKRYLAKPGYEALQLLKAKYKDSNPNVVNRINGLYRDGNGGAVLSKEEFVQSVQGDTAKLPEALLDVIHKNISKSSWRIRNNLSYQFISVDLNSNNLAEYVFIEERAKNLVFTLYYLNESGSWLSKSLRKITKSANSKEQSKEALLEALAEKDYASVSTHWQHLKVGGYTFKVL